MVARKSCNDSRKMKGDKGDYHRSEWIDSKSLKKQLRMKGKECNDTYPVKHGGLYSTTQNKVRCHRDFSTKFVEDVPNVE